MTARQEHLQGEVERGGSELCGDDRFRYYLQEKP
jgi:hypothetical protein